MISRKWLSVVAAGVLAAALTACDTGDNGGDGGNGDEGNGGAELSGTVLADGPSTVAPLSEAAAELFMLENPGVQVDVATSGTGGGFERFCIGETDISDASREIDEEEAGICADNDIAYEQLTVANDALSVVVHPDNPVDCLTVEQLSAIWNADSTLANWSEIPGLEADFDEPLELYGPGPDSGTFDYFTEAVNGEGGNIRTDYNNIGENDESGITGVQSSVGAMFFVGYTYYAENQDSVKGLAIDGGQGCAEPTPENAQNGSYTPLTRGLFIYVSDTALAKEEVVAFVEFYINNNDAIGEEVGAIPLSQEQKDAALAQVEALTG